jgi:CIC family chloride channel protein
VAEHPEEPSGSGNGVVRIVSRSLALVRALWAAPASPLDLRLLGRTLLHAALVGCCAGIVGAIFFAALEVGQTLLLEGLAGYVPARARGEALLGDAAAPPFRPWALALLPALGGLASGLLTWRYAPEAAGGGGDATIEAYHQHGGLIRSRVIPVKAAASIAALAAGGAGGREGPTMQIGAAIGSFLGRLLPVTARERRVLVVAGIAAGIAAVFRTPLGAALLAVEMLYRDDFEADALVPAILASVVAYSIVISIFGTTTLFGWLPRLSFVPAHLPLYVVLAVLVALASVAFVSAIRLVQRTSARLRVPAWARPAIGGLAMGALVTTVVWFAGAREPGGGVRGLGLLGGGYGALQSALDTAPSGGGATWSLVLLFLGLAGAKLVAAALTVGSGASAGDFAPSLVIGGLLGGAFGHACALAFEDASIQPAAFVLVGMGTFYGGIAHVPLSALVLVSELAGSYDLLVPMMLAIAVALVTLRRWTIYPSQPASKRDSPVHADAGVPSTLAETPVGEGTVAPEVGPLLETDRLRIAAPRTAGAQLQLVVPVHALDGRPRGLVDVHELRRAAVEPHLDWAVVADVMVPWAAVTRTQTLATVARTLAATGLRQLPVLEGTTVVGLVGEAEIARALLRS